MTTALIIVCIVFCIGIVVAIVGHMGYGIAVDKRHRRQRAARRHRRRRMTT